MDILIYARRQLDIRSTYHRAYGGGHLESHRDNRNYTYYTNDYISWGLVVSGRKLEGFRRRNNYGDIFHRQPAVRERKRKRNVRAVFLKWPPSLRRLLRNVDLIGRRGEGGEWSHGGNARSSCKTVLGTCESIWFAFRKWRLAANEYIIIHKAIARVLHALFEIDEVWVLQRQRVKFQRVWRRGFLSLGHTSPVILQPWVASTNNKRAC